MKPSRRATSAISASLTFLLAAAGILVWLTFRPASPPPPLPASQPEPPPSSPPPLSASEILGRRGIIKAIAGNRITLETTDQHAVPGERVEVIMTPSTSFVLITIPRTPPPRGNAITRSPLTADALTVGNDVFSIGSSNVAASTTFSALRIEKIVTP